MSNKKIEDLMVEHQLNFLKNLEMVLSGFIHDLNNPVAVIAGQSSILKTLIEMGKLSEEKALKTATKVLTSTEKMAVIQQRLRDFYKPAPTDDDKANLKLCYDTIYQLSTAKISRLELEVSSKSFEKDIAINGSPLILNMLVWNIHYLFLDKLEKNNDCELNIECSVSNEYANIEYKLEKDSLTDNEQNSTEVLVAQKYLETFGGKLEISSNGAKITLRV